MTFVGDSLFSTIITLYILILLYFPSIFIFSPTLISTIILLLSLLRLGASQSESEFNSAQVQQIHDPIDCDTDPDPKPDPYYDHSFVEWNVRAPLEIIYEEEETEQNDAVKADNIIRRYASLSMFYPESDSDSSSEGDFPAIGDWDSPEKMCFRWEDEDDREGLIEIALDYRKKCGDFVDEDNLIEIDLSPAR